MCTEVHEFYLASMRGDNEKGLDGVFAEESVSLVPIARLHLVISIQTFQSGSGDVNLTEGEKQNNFSKYGFIVKQVWNQCCFTSFPLIDYVNLTTD